MLGDGRVVGVALAVAVAEGLAVADRDGATVGVAAVAIDTSCGAQLNQKSVHRMYFEIPGFIPLFPKD